jgi:hypothetical protein
MTVLTEAIQADEAGTKPPSLIPALTAAAGTGIVGTIGRQHFIPRASC